MTFLSHLLDLSLDAAPYLLFGLLLAGLIKAWLPEAWVRKQLNGKGSRPVIKAALLGAPMPLCSCSVIPVALGIRRNGASKGATTSFLISTPETGVDSISLTYAMMGPVMAIVRPVAAILTALTAGLWVNNQTSRSCCSEAKPPTESKPLKDKASSGCCSSKQEAPVSKCCSESSEKTFQPHSSNTSCCASEQSQPAVEPSHSSCCSSKKKKEERSSCCSSHQESQETSSCCSSESKSNPSQITAVQGISYAFNRLYEDILLWLAAGLIIAAAVQTYVPTDWLAQWGSGWIAKFIMLVIGIPMYICASASTPMAAGLMLAGVSPGTVLVFLLAGPATNVSTIAILRDELGNSVMVKYIVTVMLGALLSGVLLDALLMESSLNLVEQHHAHSEMLPHWFSLMALGTLLLATIKPVRQAFFKKLGA